MGKTKIIKRDAVSAFRIAQQRIVDAEAEKSRLIAESIELCRQEQEKAFAQGIEGARREQMEIIAATLGERARLLSSISQEVGELVLFAIHKLCGQIALAGDEARVRTVVREAIETLKNSRQVVLRVNPSDADVARETATVLREYNPPTQLVRVDVDPSVMRGDCVAVSDLGVVELRLEAQLEVLKNALNQHSTDYGQS